MFVGTSQTSRSDAIERVVDLLDSVDVTTSNTSMRIPRTLCDAAGVAVAELGVAESTTSLTTAALRAVLEGIVTDAALTEHYRVHPGARPGLGDLAIAAAELDGHHLAATPDVLRAAAAQIVETHPDADADDVILWAEAQRMAPA